MPHRPCFITHRFARFHLALPRFAPAPGLDALHVRATWPSALLLFGLPRRPSTSPVPLPSTTASVDFSPGSAPSPFSGTRRDLPGKNAPSLHNRRIYATSPDHESFAVCRSLALLGSAFIRFCPSVRSLCSTLPPTLGHHAVALQFVRCDPLTVGLHRRSAFMLAHSTKKPARETGFTDWPERTSRGCNGRRSSLQPSRSPASA